jgi:hypothetical protein
MVEVCRSLERASKGSSKSVGPKRQRMALVNSSHVNGP